MFVYENPFPNSSVRATEATSITCFPYSARDAPFCSSSTIRCLFSSFFPPENNWRQQMLCCKPCWRWSASRWRAYCLHRYISFRVLSWWYFIVKAKVQLFLEYAKENGRKLWYILNFLPFMMQSFDYLIFLNVIVLGYEALPSRLYFKTILVELMLCMV